ncbi:MAG: class I SAM-dependent methyltransferase [Patescibacteria group bacterium]
MNDSMKKIDHDLKNIGFHNKNDWKHAQPDFGKHELRILDHPVMEDWEKPYMKRLAEIATSNGGKVLEVGFGMGLSASYIQDAPQLKLHIIIEANDLVAKKAQVFADKSRHKTKVILGLWEEVIDEIPDGSLDGILFDTYPLSTREYRNHYPFFPFAYKKLKPGGVLTYFSDEAVRIKPYHMKKLLGAGFKRKNISSDLVDIDTPENCQYWQSKTILSPRVIK